jgi:hypothetical protein
MIQVRFKGRREMQNLERREDVCATEYCMNAPLLSSHYCRACRKNVLAKMESERLRFFDKSAPYDFTRVNTNLYAIAAGKEAVKFGFAKDVDSRLRDIQVGNHVKLTLLAAIKCNRYLEGLVHEYLRNEWMTGEWHAVTERTKLVISRMQKQDIEGLVTLITV